MPKRQVICSFCSKSMQCNLLKRHQGTCKAKKAAEGVRKFNYGPNYPNLVNEVSDVVALRMTGFYHIMCSLAYFKQIIDRQLMRVFCHCECQISDELNGHDVNKDHVHALVECRDWTRNWSKENSMIISKRKVRIIPVHCAVAFANVVHYISCSKGQHKLRKMDTNIGLQKFVKTNEHHHINCVVNPKQFIHTPTIGDHKNWAYNYLIKPYYLISIGIDYEEYIEQLQVYWSKLCSGKSNSNYLPPLINEFKNDNFIKDSLHHKCTCMCYDGEVKREKARIAKEKRREWFDSQKKKETFFNVPVDYNELSNM